MPHICISKSSQRWLVTYSAPSHYLDQCWVIVNWIFGNDLPWNFDLSFTKIHLEISSLKRRPFCQGGRGEGLIQILFTAVSCVPWLLRQDKFTTKHTIEYLCLGTIFHQNLKVISLYLFKLWKYSWLLVHETLHHFQHGINTSAK